MVDWVHPILFAHDHLPSLGYTAIIYTHQLADNNANKARLHKQCMYTHIAKWDSEQTNRLSTHRKISITTTTLLLRATYFQKNDKVNAWTSWMWSWAYPTIIYTHLQYYNNIIINFVITILLQNVINIIRVLTHTHSARTHAWSVRFSFYH